MIVLIPLLIIAAFIIAGFSVLEDLAQLIEEQLEEDTALCSGCQRHFVVVGCPVHDPEERRAA